MKLLLSALCFCSLTGAAAAAGMVATTPTTVSYVDSSTPSAPQYRQYSASAWSSAASTTGVSSSVDWQLLRTCPTRDEVSLLTCSDDYGLRLQIWDGFAWGAVSTLAANCGSYDDRVFDAEYEHVSGRLLTVYRKANDTNIYFRSYSSASPAEQTYSPGLATAPIWIKLTSNPRSNEIILLVATTNKLRAAVWNGTSFGNLATPSSSPATNLYPYDAAYCYTSGVACVVWGNAGSSTPQYATWNGTTWSATAALPAVGGTPTLMKLAMCQKTASNEIMLACLDSAKHLSVCRFDGTSWGSMTSVETAAGSAYERRFDLSYERDSGQAVILWSKSGQNALCYRSWSGSSWSGTLSGPNPGSEARTIRLVPGVSSPDEIVAAVQARGPTSLGDYQIYSQSGTSSTGSASVEGLVGQQIAGVTLPAAPTNTPGTTDLTYGNNTTTTIAPGAYRDLSMGNSFVGSFSSGTYVFRNCSSGNTTTFNCNTASGDITIIFTGTVAAWNNLSINNSGNGRVIFELTTGNFSANNNASVFGASIIAFNGTIDFGNNLSVEGCLYAKGNISVSTGNITETPIPPVPPSPASLQIVRWTGGAFGSLSTFNSNVPGWASRQAWGISAPPVGCPVLYISRWHEVGQDE